MSAKTVPLAIALSLVAQAFVREDVERCGRSLAGRRALLLSAGELGRVLFLQSFQLEAAQLLLRAAALFGVAAGADAAPDVLQHRHVRKEGVLLEEIPYPPLLRREIDVLFAVEERVSPSRMMCPLSGVMIPAMHLSVTLLPQPEAPSSAMRMIAAEGHG